MIHTPEDMTVTVAADVTLAELQAALARSRQWLPLDPPNPGLTLRAILDRNESGPRRYGYGTARDYVIGLSVTLADGRGVKSGGQVVKNVAGYDLQKLFIGSGGTLGTIQEVTFKLRPRPEVEVFVGQECGPAELPHFAKCGSAEELIERVVSSDLQPVVFDFVGHADGKYAVVLGFDGPRADVDWQVELAARLGFTAAATLDDDKSFRSGTNSPRKLSVLPSQLIETVRALGGGPFVARAGNGIIFHRTETSDLPGHPRPTTRQLERRLKDAFDPQHLLPELPA